MQGFCPDCHDLRTADDQSRCVVCHQPLADCEVVSRLVEEPAPQAAAAPVAARRNPLRNCLVMLTILFLTAVLLFQSELSGQIAPILASLQGRTLAPTLTRTHRPTITPQPSLTPLPSRTPNPSPTPRPTKTATPAPVEVTFDSIGKQARDRLVILIGRLDLMSSTKCTTQGERTTCGLLLENPSNPDQKITIFVPVGDQPNQMKPLPETYTKGDIQVRLDDGTYAVVGYRLRVHGRVCITTVNTPCISDITKIELVQLK
jgi:hypothetical protein